MTDQVSDGRAATALRYERWPVAELRQDPHNARLHPPDNLAAIKASLHRWGQVLPVLVRHGQLVAGNGTVLAADELGLTHLDVVIGDHLDEAEARKLAVALNRTAELASWDRPVLLDTLRPYLDDLDGTGFTAAQLAELERLEHPVPLDTSPQLGGLEYRIVVDCASEAHQAELVQRFQADGLVCRAVIT